MRVHLIDGTLELFRYFHSPAAAAFDRSAPEELPGTGLDSAAPFGWRYAHREVWDASARVTPLAAPGSSIPVSHLLP